MNTVLPRDQISRQNSFCLNKVMAIFRILKSKTVGENVVRDVAGVYSRLFDHRAVLQNLCKFVIREFEGKRNDREAFRLAEAFKVLNKFENKI